MQLAILNMYLTVPRLLNDPGYSESAIYPLHCLPLPDVCPV